AGLGDQRLAGLDGGGYSLCHAHLGGARTEAGNRLGQRTLFTQGFGAARREIAHPPTPATLTSAPAARSDSGRRARRRSARRPDRRAPRGPDAPWSSCAGTAAPAVGRARRTARPAAPPHP